MSYRVVRKSANTGRVLRVIETGFATKRDADLYAEGFGVDAGPKTTIAVESAPEIRTLAERKAAIRELFEARERDRKAEGERRSTQLAATDVHRFTGIPVRQASGALRSMLNDGELYRNRPRDGKGSYGVIETFYGLRSAA